MPVDGVEDLVELLRSHLPRRGMSPECRTGMASRYLRGGSCIDTCAAFRVHPACMYHALLEVVDAVNDTSALALDIGLRSPQRRLGFAGVFQSQRSSSIYIVLGALDCVAIQQEHPLANDVQCIAEYYLRKGSHSLNTQAISDADCKFFWMSCMSPGSSHESSACTELGRTLLDPAHVLTRAMVQDGLCIVAHEAYGASEVLAVPWPGCNRGDRWRGSYKFLSVIDPHPY